MKRGERLKHLESLVARAAHAIERLTTENDRLKIQVEKLRSDKLKYEVDFRKFKALSRRQEQFRGRVERATKKIDKILGMTE